jgi:hypothetical protein
LTRSASAPECAIVGALIFTAFVACPATATVTVGDSPVFTVTSDAADAIAVDCSGGLLVRSAFGFRGAILITGAAAGNCSRCTAEDIEAYIERLY